MKCACTTGPADCVVIWSPWTPCNVVCGTGVKWRFSRIVTFPRNGGRPCPPIVEAAPCESIRCNPMLAPNDWQDALRGTLEYSVYCSYVFGRVCLNVCVSADFWKPFWISTYIIRIFGSSSYIKVIRSRSRSRSREQKRMPVYPVRGCCAFDWMVILFWLINSTECSGSENACVGNDLSDETTRKSVLSFRKRLMASVKYEGRYFEHSIN